MKMMHFILVIITIIFFNYNLLAQVSYLQMMEDHTYNFYEVVKAAEAYFSENDKGKGSGYKQYIRWKNENESKFHPSGNRFDVDYNSVIEHYKRHKTKNLNAAKKSAINNAWIDLGPYSSFYQDGYPRGIGRIETIWVNPTNDQHILFGSKSGGFWKTINGGIDWTNTTDFLVSTGVNSITVKPNDHEEVLISLRSSFSGRTKGIYRSSNGGDTWLETNFNPINNGELSDISIINKVIYHPRIPDLVFVSTDKGLYFSYNLTDWTRSNLPNNQATFDQNISDIEFHPTNDNIIYAMYSWTSNFALRSVNQGLNFEITGELVGNGFEDGFIATSPAEQNSLWFASNNGIWKSVNAGESFSFIVNPDEKCDEFAVSDVDAEQQIYGYIDIHASLGNSNTFIKTTNWWNVAVSSTYVHADLRTAICVWDINKRKLCFWCWAVGF